jgi:hypothetical protein
MCNNDENGRIRPPRSPAERLSDLIEKETGARIEPKLLRLFLKAKWDRVTPLAHAIHDAD